MGGKGPDTQTFKPPKAFMNAYKDSLRMARKATDDPYRAYRGDLVAGLTPTQKRGIANVNAAQGMALPAIQQGMKYTKQAARGVTPKLYEQYYSPYVKDVAKATQRNLMESQAQQQSALKAGAIQGGAFGGDRSGVAMAEMARQQQLGNALAMSNIYNQGYGQAMDLAGRQVSNLGAMGQQMAGLGAAAQGSVLQGAQAQMAAGLQQQATKQAALDAAYQQWMQKRAYPYQNAQFFANIAQGLGAGAGGTSTTQPANNWLSQLAGVAGAVGSIASASPSDKRVKENIEAVGSLNDGQTIYRYNFKGDPKTQIGLLAQEVEHSKPGAVMQTKGLKMVNYKTATDDAAEMSHAGGSVFPSTDRQGLAAGGIPFYPYGDSLAYVPEGKIAGRSANIPDAPALDKRSLSEQWKDINPIDEKSAAGLKKLAGDVGIEFPSFGQSQGVYANGGLVGYSNGGTAARTNYADGGVGVADYPVAEEEVVYDIPAGLAAAESGNDFGAQNEQGYVGRLQFGPARLEDAKRAGVIPVDMTPEDFRDNPEAQKATERWHLGDINEFIDKSGLGSVEGKKINGVPVTREGLVRVAHLGGKGGLQKFVASGGEYNPADANGTRLSDYLALASNTGVAGGDVVDKNGVAAAADIPDPNAPVESGYVVKGEKPGLKFDISKLFASEENPSIIERIMGRRLSPEARSAVLNASFALMAGRSPYFLTNLGEAGKVGTQTYYNALNQKRELAKQQADIALEKEARDIQRMGTSAQIASVILPLIKTLAATGQPIPPQYQRILDKAFPPGSDERAKIDREITSGGVSTVTDTTPGAMPQTTKDQSIGVPSAPVVEDELRSIYEKLSPELNPYEWDRRANQADSAGATELAQQYRDRAQKIRDTDYERGFINVPGQGRVPWPEKIEQELDVAAQKKRQDIALDARQKADEAILTTQSGFSQKTQTLTGLANALAMAETGSLSEFKAQTINFLNSFGLAGSDEVQQATNIQDVSRLLGEALANNPDVKQNFGPQISNTDIKIMMGVQGSVADLPGANRRVVGTALGKLAWDKEKVRAWQQFTEKADAENKLITPSEIMKFNSDFSEGKYTNGKRAIDYISESIANTPVMGDVDWSKIDRRNLKKGYKYIIPKGKYPVGEFPTNVVVMWDGENLQEVE